MDLIGLARNLEEKYRRYLKTTFYFRDPALRKSFEEALDGGHLSKGPYVEAMPVFERSRSPSTLFSDLLGTQLEPAFLRAIQGERPLYAHQEEAIDKVYKGRNVIVATGTGSGKTESFLYPILLHLYQESQRGDLCPGVRALVLYPMNALANDQRERLAEVCKNMKRENSGFRLTFGQYIGETPEDGGDFQRHAQDHLTQREHSGHCLFENGKVVHGELVLRSEMRASPPHILLTNYSMLEYLLLRPDDSQLFDNGRAEWWTFLVLDEAHQYRGSRGIEMAMLIRRLKQRLREGGSAGRFKCIATSATLVGEEKDRSAVANFASDLFGEEFREGDVILGRTQSPLDSGSHTLSLNTYALLTEVLENQDSENLNRLSETMSEVGEPIPSGEEITRTVGRALRHDARSSLLLKSISSEPGEVYKTAAQVFGDIANEQQLSSLVSLVDLLARAKDPLTGIPLLSARYHLFLRSLEGAFVTYWPEKKVSLDRKLQDEESVAFEVALCRECGQHYFVGSKGIKEGKLSEAIRDPSHPNFGATFLRPLEDGAEEEGEGEEDSGSKTQVLRLCVRCGELTSSDPKCGHGDVVTVAKERAPEDEDRADQLLRCGACGYNAAGRDPVRELVHGADGPNAVIATTLYQNFPIARRKVLAFADGRQEAAFFAWYLEDSYKDILSRNLILGVVRDLGSQTREGLSLKEVAAGLRDTFRTKRIFPPATGDLQLRWEAWRSIYREFVTDEPRISLEGVALIRWFIKRPDWLALPSILKDKPWSLSEDQASDLVSLLLDSMRADKAIELLTEKGVSLIWNDLALQSSQKRFRIGDPGRYKGSRVQHKGIKSWDGKTGKRVQFLLKLLKKKGVPEEEAVEEAVRLLRSLWESIKQCDERAPTSRDRLLISADDARRLNADWWRVTPLDNEDNVFQCMTCGRLQAVSVLNLCQRHRCPGTLKETPVKNLEPNHYRLLYEDVLPGLLRVEEHTAQLEKEKAREFQREFRLGNINVLSCSTTFELGVDLGDLDTIFLRNVPPEPFNYAQRVGRAGRRVGYPGFAVTYCRRGPHDLYHFSEPRRILSGKTRPASLSLRNDKIIARHIMAMALSHFFRTHPDRFATVEALFRDLGKPTGVDDLRGLLIQNQERLAASLRSIVPEELFNQLGLLDGSWIERVAGDDCRLRQAEEDVSSSYQTVRDLEGTAAGRGDYDSAKWAKARLKTIAEEDVLSFLSRKAVIPKYGFPVDVVELDTQRTLQSHETFEVSLQRDLSIAISEFAPTSKLIANKKVWVSYGLKKVAEKEWDRWWYARCTRHNRFERRPWAGDSSIPSFEKCCNAMVVNLKYIDPKFGFVTSRSKPEEPRQRPTRVFTTRPYFAGFKAEEGEKIDFTLVRLTPVSPGCLVVLCEGRRGAGFYICRGCGAGFRHRERDHNDPYGERCHGMLEQVSLGHEFVTDVLQLEFIARPQNGMDPFWFAHSLAFALVEGAAEILDVPSTDLSATVTYAAQEGIPPTILYDNVPGGAGLVARLQDEAVLKACLESARRRVDGGCGCAETTSCYGCLRSYRNQFAHQYIQRGPVQGYLDKMLSEW